MNPRTFLKQFAQDIDRDRMVTAVYGEMVEYCSENEITESDISTTELEAVAEGFVTRAFTFEREGKSKYRSEAWEDAMEELGSATDGTRRSE